MAKLYPIHKGGSKFDPANYRPISILSTISKKFEKHINKHLVAFLNKYKVIHTNQSGFRQKHKAYMKDVNGARDAARKFQRGILEN